jgi:hypothetical protein
MNSKAIRELEAEAHEIICNIRDAARNGDITWSQRDELLRIVYEDVNGKLKLAAGLLHDWTGKYYSDEMPLAS